MISHSHRLILSWSLALTTIFSLSASAQDRRPLSPRAFSATQVQGHHDVREGYVDGKWIEIHYGRPIKRGRDLFGPPDFVPALNDGAPVWRAGANYSTTLNTEVPLVINGVEVEPGEYTVFIQLDRLEWIFILSSYRAQKKYDYYNKKELFGAYGYRPERDVLRLEMKLEELPHSHDQLHWQFLNMTDRGGRLAIFWDTKMASIPFLIHSPARSRPSE